MDLPMPLFGLDVDSQPAQSCPPRDGPSLRISCNLPYRGLANNGQFLHPHPWRRAVSSQSPSLSSSNPREDSSLNDDNGTDENPICLAQLNQELDSIQELRAAPINDLHHHHQHLRFDNANSSPTLLTNSINPTLSDAEIEYILEGYGVSKGCDLTRSVTATIKIGTPEQALVLKEALGLDVDGWTLQVGDRPRSSDATPTDIMGGLWFARLSQDEVVSPPFVPPTDFGPGFYHCDGLAGFSEPSESIHHNNSQGLGSSEAPSTERAVGGYLRRHYQKRTTLSPPINEKVCKRRGIRKPADDCRRGRQRQRSLLKKRERDTSHHSHRCSKAKHGRASLPGADLDVSDLHDRLHAYALLKHDQPNINQHDSLPGDQLNAQSLRLKIPHDDDPYDAQESALPSPLYSSETQSDIEGGGNEKMAWMLMPNGFPGVAPSAR